MQGEILVAVFVAIGICAAIKEALDKRAVRRKIERRSRIYGTDP